MEVSFSDAWHLEDGDGQHTHSLRLRLGPLDSLNNFSFT